MQPRSQILRMVSRMAPSGGAWCVSNTVTMPVASPEQDLRGDAMQSLTPVFRISRKAGLLGVGPSHDPEIAFHARLSDRARDLSWDRARVTEAGAAAAGRTARGGNPASASMWNWSPASTKIAIDLGG